MPVAVMIDRSAGVGMRPRRKVLGRIARVRTPTEAMCLPEGGRDPGVHASGGAPEAGAPEARARSDRARSRCGVTAPGRWTDHRHSSAGRSDQPVELTGRSDAGNRQAVRIAKPAPFGCIR